MGDTELLRLAHGLECLGSELDHCRRQCAQTGSSDEGPAWNALLEQQRSVLITADKIERQLKYSVPFNPAALLNIEFPLEEALDSVAGLLESVEEIKQAAITQVHEVPPMTRSFHRMLENYLSALGGQTA
jgi:hypothetical protein